MTVHKHDQYSRCESCGAVGAYYYGDDIPSRKAAILEEVLEGIERYYADSRWFTTMDLSRSVQIWWSSVRTALMWLEHLGIIERSQAYTNAAIHWRVSVHD